MSSNNKSTVPAWAIKLVFIFIGSVLLTLLAVYIFIKLQDLLLWIVLSLFLSFALEPLVNQLMHKGLSRVLATFLVVFGFTSLLVLLFASMFPIIIEQSNEIIKQSPEWLSSIVNIYNNFAGTNISESDLLNKVTASEQFLSNYLANLAGNLFGFGRQIFSGLLQVLGVLLFTFYFVLDGPHLRRIICSFLSPKQQKLVLNTWEMAIEKTGGFMYSRLLLGAISIIVHFVAFSLLGIPFALPLAIWMGVVSQFVPVVGTYVASALPILMALTQGLGASIAILIIIVIYQQIENYILLPKISQKTMELHPAIAFGAVIAGATLGGIIGAFLALPVAAMLQEIFRLYIGQNEVIESRLTSNDVNILKKRAN